VWDISPKNFRTFEKMFSLSIFLLAFINYT
jgi:hypothetical protein